MNFSNDDRNDHSDPLGGNHDGNHGTARNGTDPGSDCHCGPKAPGCENMILLGDLPEMDPCDGNIGAERAASTLGGTSYGTQADPLYRHLVEVRGNDQNGDGVIRTDDGHERSRAETISHDADGDGTAREYRIDTTFVVRNTEVTFLKPDGGTETCILPVRILQDTDGNTFLMPPPNGASPEEIEALTSQSIVSVSFPEDACNYDLCYSGIFTDRSCFPCFVRGTLIETEHGPVAVEDLAPGMRVLTHDRGPQPLRWVGSRALCSKTLQINPAMRPIRIVAGALGKDLPRRDLLVSPQHRILIRSRIAQKMFGAPEVLVAAKQLLQIEGIDIAHDQAVVEYFHFLFDRHEIVLSEGAATELLYTGSEALRSIGHHAREEIFAIFPELRDRPEDATCEGARLLASGRMGRKLAVRHAQHAKALVQ